MVFRRLGAFVRMMVKLQVSATEADALYYVWSG